MPKRNRQNEMKTKKKEVKIFHALLTVGLMMIIMFTAIVKYDAEPQIPLVFSCLIAGLVSVWIGYDWEEILQGMLEGIQDSLEAILILMLIGILVGSWIAGGTVPTMIYYGLQIVSPKIFLPATMLICLLVAFAIGSWGTMGTVGLAFMGIGMALGIPSPFVAGAVISGAYMGEVISPLSDATNLCAAVVGKSVFSIVKRIAKMALLACGISVIFYAFLAHKYGTEDSFAVKESIEPILLHLSKQFHITPLALLPMLLMVLFILLKMPAIPAMMIGALGGMLEAACLQGESLRQILQYAYSGFVSRSGNESMDQLLTAGGMERMLYSISIILIAMSFGGIMKKSRQMETLVRPLVSHIQSASGLSLLTVLTCIFMNIVLPDQYLGISMPGQMYGEEYEKRQISRVELGYTLLAGGAVTSPLVPWNTCGIYCSTILGVTTWAYAPYVVYAFILPILVVIFSFIGYNRR